MPSCDQRHVLNLMACIRATSHDSSRRLETVSDCCDPVAYRKMFNTKDANRRLARYRRKGLEPLIGGIVEWLTSRGIDNSTVLEIGGGVGGVQVELLKAGASNATNVEMSAAYAPAFTSLAAENGFEMRMRQLFGDFVEVQDGIEPAGIVILNKVICCYPYMERMMAAATSKTQRHLGMVFPATGLPRELAWVGATDTWPCAGATSADTSITPMRSKKLPTPKA